MGIINILDSKRQPAQKRDRMFTESVLILKTTIITDKTG